MMEGRRDIEEERWLSKNSSNNKGKYGFDEKLRYIITLTPDMPSDPNIVALERIIPQQHTNNCSL